MTPMRMLGRTRSRQPGHDEEAAARSSSATAHGNPGKNDVTGSAKAPASVSPWAASCPPTKRSHQSVGADRSARDARVLEDLPSGHPYRAGQVTIGGRFRRLRCPAINDRDINGKQTSAPRSRGLRTPRRGSELHC